MAGSGAGLKAIATLARQPEKAWIGQVRPDYRQAIDREAAQASPFMVDPPDPPVDNLLQPVDGDGDIQFFGRGVAGRGCGLIVRAKPQLSACVGLEIEAAVERDHEWQVGRCIGLDA